MLHDPDKRGRLERQQCITERPAGQLRDGEGVDLVALEVQQLPVDHGQARLPAGLGGDSRDHVPDEHHFHFVAADHAGHVKAALLADLGHHVVRLLAALRVVDDGQQHLEHICIRVLAWRRQDDDRPRGLDVDHFQLRQVDGIAAAADDARPAGVRDARVDGVLHGHFVHVREHGDGGAALVGVGLDQLGQDGEDLLVPAQDHHVIALDHP